MVTLTGDHHRSQDTLRGDLDRAAFGVLDRVEPLDVHAKRGQAIDDRQQVVVGELVERHVAVGDRRGQCIGARHDPVGHDRVVSPAQLVHAVDCDPRRAGAGDSGAHRIQKLGEVGDLRLAGGGLDDRPAAGERRSRHHVGRPQHRRAERPSQEDRRADEVVRLGDDVTATKLDPGTEGLQATEVQVHGPFPEHASARHRHRRVAATSQQRAQYTDPRPHRANHLVACVRGAVVMRRERHRAMPALYVHAQLAQQPGHVVDVRQVRDASKRHRPVRQQGGRHERQARVL